MLTRSVVVVVLALSACGEADNPSTSASPSDSQPSATHPVTSIVAEVTSSSLAEPVLNESDIAAILGASVRAAVDNNPGGPVGVDQGERFVFADTLGEARDQNLGVRFDRNPRPLSEIDRAAIQQAMLPGSVTFASAESDSEMWQFAQPDVGDDSVVVTYQHHCGGGANMCDSGGAFRLQRLGETWQAEMISNWIA